MFRLNTRNCSFLLALALLATVQVVAQPEPQSKGHATDKPEKTQTVRWQPDNTKERPASKSEIAPLPNQTANKEQTPFTLSKATLVIPAVAFKTKDPSVKTCENGTFEAQQAAADAQASATDEEALRKAALNPIASLISVTVQNDVNLAVGPNRRRLQDALNIQPVIPVKLSRNWNMIMRIIAPVVHQPDTTTKTKSTFGLGDINPSFFFSPAKVGKVIWGIGPSFILPTATSTTLGQGKLQIGPAAVVLVQPGRWTLGVLANNTWSVAGKSHRAPTHQGNLEYLISYEMNKGYYLAWQPTISFDWKAERPSRWLVPFGGGIGRIMKLGPQPVDIGIQVFANAVRPPNSSPFTLGVQIAFLYPKK